MAFAMEHFTAADIAKFWSNVNVGKNRQCWEWTRGRQGAGYGAAYIDDGSGRRVQMLAHRVACAIAHGPAPDGKASALHSCDNPPCCNPAHLRWGSQKENTADAIDRDRASPPPSNTAYRRRDTQPKGGEVWNQTLTEEQVRKIWRLHLAGGMTTGQIAEAVGAKQHVVADVARGRSWRHLEGAPSVDELKSGGVRRGYNQFTLPRGNAREVGFSGA